MRNLKKILALTLAFVMVFALMSGFVSAADEVTTATAAVEDSADLRLVKALGIMTDGRANDSVKRGEFAKMMCVAKIGTALNISSLTGGNFFTDEANHWSAPYVNYLRSFKLVDGVSATEFKPESNITVLQALKMCLSILGYNYTKDTERLDYTNDWEGWTINYALESGLLDDALLSEVIDINALCTREVAAEIIVNALFANQVSYSTVLATYNKGDNTSTFAYKVFGNVKYVNGTLSTIAPASKTFNGYTGYAISQKNLGANAEFYAVGSKAITEPIITGAKVIEVKSSALVEIKDNVITAYSDKIGGTVVAKASLSANNATLTENGKTYYFVGPVAANGLSYSVLCDNAEVKTVTDVTTAGGYYLDGTLTGKTYYANLTDLVKGDVFVQKFNFDTGLWDVEKLVGSVVTLKGENYTQKYLIGSDGTQYKWAAAQGEQFANYDALRAVMKVLDGTEAYTIYQWNGGVVKAEVYKAPEVPAAEKVFCVVAASKEGNEGKAADIWGDNGVAAVNAKAQVYFMDGTTAVYEVASLVKDGKTTVGTKIKKDDIKADTVYSYVIADGKLTLTEYKDETGEVYGKVEVKDGKVTLGATELKKTTTTKVLYKVEDKGVVSYKLVNLSAVKEIKNVAKEKAFAFAIGAKTGALYTYSTLVITEKDKVTLNPVADPTVKDKYIYISELGDKVYDSTLKCFIYNGIKLTYGDGTTATVTAKDTVITKTGFIKDYIVADGALTKATYADSAFTKVATQGAIIDGQYINLATVKDAGDLKAYTLSDKYYGVNTATIATVDLTAAGDFSTLFNAYAEFDGNTLVSLWIVK